MGGHRSNAIVVRSYHLYAMPSGRYEIVPDGISALALVLGPIWSFANGLIVEHIAILALFMLPAILCAGAGIEAVAALIVAAGFVYFSMIAHKLRARDLVRNGYKKIATVQSTSAHRALREWARSDEARSFLEMSGQ